MTPNEPRRPQQQPPAELTRSKTEQQNRQLDPETRDRKATNDGQVRRPNGVGDSDDIGSGR
jgi:hypothetical protein